MKGYEAIQLLFLNAYCCCSVSIATPPDFKGPVLEHITQEPYGDRS